MDLDMRGGAVDWQEQNRSKQILPQSLEWFKQREISTSNIPETIPTLQRKHLPQCVCLWFSVDVSHSESDLASRQLQLSWIRLWRRNFIRISHGPLLAWALSENDTLGRVHFSKGSTLLQSNNNHHCCPYNTTSMTAEPKSKYTARDQISQKKEWP